jgi:hypothetical protein
VVVVGVWEWRGNGPSEERKGCKVRRVLEDVSVGKDDDGMLFPVQLDGTIMFSLSVSLLPIPM